jgi:hypothetical protein
VNIGHLLNQALTVQSQSGADANGDPTWAAQRTVKVRIQQVMRRVYSEKGISYVPVDQLMTDQPILTGDRYWPPGADTADGTQARRLGRVITAPTLDASYTVYQVDL